MKTDSYVIILCLFLAGVIFAIDIHIPLGVASGVPYITVILVSLWSEKKSVTVISAIIASILTILGLYFSPPGGEMWKVLLNRALALFAIWITAILGSERRKVIIEREKALQDRESTLKKIKILSGLLPICASCKKIRDDQGYWNNIADYISQHSEAEFTHGICSECAKKLYPEFYHKGEQENDET